MAFLVARVLRERFGVAVLYDGVDVLDLVHGEEAKQLHFVRPNNFTIQMLSGEGQNSTNKSQTIYLHQIRLLNTEIREKLSVLPHVDHMFIRHFNQRKSILKLFRHILRRRRLFLTQISLISNR